MKPLLSPFKSLVAALLIGVSAQAATVVIKVSDFPNTNRLNGTDLLLIAVPGITNKNITWDQFRAAIGTNPASITIITNAYITNLSVNFITNNVLISTNAYISNEFVTNLFATFITNNTFISTNTYISNAFITNLFVTSITNNTLITTNVTVNNDITVKGNATVNVINSLSTSATNGFYVGTNAWAGPTNTVDLANQDQYYKTFTPVSVTGFINKSNHVVEGVILTITNAAGSNVLFTLATGLNIPERTNQVTISNASQAMLSIKYSPLAGTNGVFRQF